MIEFQWETNRRLGEFRRNRYFRKFANPLSSLLSGKLISLDHFNIQALEENVRIV
jgi:hypothetical protein